MKKSLPIILASVVTSLGIYTASQLQVSVTNFDGALSATDTDIQTALETLDDGVATKNYVDAGYVEARVGIGDWDWNKDDLTIDNTWYELDLSTNQFGSNVVPVGARFVILRQHIQDDTVPVAIFSRAASTTNLYAVNPTYVNVANVPNSGSVIVPLSGTNCLIGYKVSTAATNATEAAFVVVGWGR